MDKIPEEKESFYKEGFELYRKINLIILKKHEFLKHQQFEQAIILRDEQIKLENQLDLVTHEIDRKEKRRKYKKSNPHILPKKCRDGKANNETGCNYPIGSCELCDSPF